MEETRVNRRSAALSGRGVFNGTAEPLFTVALTNDPPREVHAPFLGRAGVLRGRMSLRRSTVSASKLSLWPFLTGTSSRRAPRPPNKSPESPGLPPGPLGPTPDHRHPPDAPGLLFRPWARRSPPCMPRVSVLRRASSACRKGSDGPRASGRGFGRLVLDSQRERAVGVDGGLERFVPFLDVCTVSGRAVAVCRRSLVVRCSVGSVPPPLH